jgi:hypothetical protein
MKKPMTEYTPEQIRDLSVEVYKMRLEDSSLGGVSRMLEKDDDDGAKMRGRAASYDKLTRAYLKVLGGGKHG